MDFTHKHARGDYPVVGTVVKTRELAQRKYADAAVWETLEQQVNVRDGDTLRTDDGSGIIVRFRDGTILELEENTMIVVSRRGDSLDLGFAGGSVVAVRPESGGGDVQLVSGKGRVSLDSGSVTAQKEGDTMSVNSESGSVSIPGGPKIGPDSMALVSSQGAATAKSVPLALTEPAAGSRFVPPQGGVLFKGRSEAGTGVTLDISRTDDFTGRFLSVPMKGGRVVRHLQPGRYRARLRSGKPGAYEQISSPVPFEILQDNPLRLVSPAMDGVFTFTDGKPVIPFMWEGGNELSAFTVEVSPVSTPGEVLAGTGTAGRTFTVDSLGEGTYRWTVKVSGNGENGPVARSGRFIIRRIRELAPPELLFPRDGRRLPLQAVRGDRVMFGWKSDPLASSFRVLIAPSGDFTRPVLDRQVRSNLLTCPRTLAPGDYSWRVESVAADGTKASASSPFRFIVSADIVLAPLSPLPGAVLVRAKDGDVPLEWRGGEDMTFRVKVDGPGGRGISLSTTDTHSLLKGVPEGMYRWRITGMDSAGEALLESDMMTFHVADRPPAPLILYPAEGDTVNLREKDYFIMKWKGPDGNFVYRLSLSAPGGEVLLRAQTRKSEFRFTRLKLLDRGTFTWTVRADRTFGPGKRTIEGERASSVFRITLGEMLKKPEILTPPTVYLR